MMIFSREVTLFWRSSCQFLSAIFLVCAFSVSTVAADPAQNAFAGKGGTPLENFVVNAMIINMTEIEAGNLAQKKSQSGHVQTFAQRMVRHHTAINQRLVGLSREKDIQIPETKDIVERAQPALKALKTSASFDMDYANNQITSHEKAIAFLNQADALEDEQIKVWARDTLAKNHDHLENAKAVRDLILAEGDEAGQQAVDQ